MSAHNVHIFVGGSGLPQTGNATAGGWNGGGAVTTCKAGAHAGTGGGMTHVSYTNNLAVADASCTNKNGHWDPTGTIGCAGGGGGGRGVANTTSHGGAGGGKTAGSGKYDERWKKNHFPSGATQTTGYKQGIGEPCANSSAAGGGWYGGFSTGQTVQTKGGRCRGTGGGGSGYICAAGEQTKYTLYNLCLVGTDASVPTKPNASDPLGVHGYVRITIKDRL